MGEINQGIKISDSGYWEEQIAHWQRSELSQIQFCKGHGLNYNSFAYWRAKLSSAKQRQQGGRFLPVRVEPEAPEQASATVIRVKHPSGFMIELPLGLAPNELKTIFSILGLSSC